MLQFETASKRLEEFIHVHDIRWIHSYRNQDGLTVWVFHKTPELEEVVAEYRRIIARRYNQRRT